MKKNLSLKRALTIFACLAMVLVAGFTLAACGETQTNDYITPGTNASFSGSPDVKYNNASDFTLVYKGNNHYEATGSLATMDATQATTWGGVQEGAKYCVLNVKTGKDATGYIGWRSVEDKDKPFTEEEATSDGVNVKKTSASNETKNYILALTDGVNERYPDKPIWRIQITPKDSTEEITYTIDFSNLLGENA